MTSISNTVGKYIYIGYWDLVDIRDDEYTLHREYGSFKAGGDPESVTRRIL